MKFNPAQTIKERRSSDFQKFLVKMLSCNIHKMQRNAILLFYFGCASHPYTTRVNLLQGFKPSMPLLFNAVLVTETSIHFRMDASTYVGFSSFSAWKTKRENVIYNVRCKVK